MKMGFVYEAAYPSTQSTRDRQEVRLHYSDNNYPGHTGWKEITALASAGSLLRSSVPATDRSGELSNYPTDLLTSPPQDLEAFLVAALPPLPATVADAQSGVASVAAIPASTELPKTGAAAAMNHSKGAAGTVLKQSATPPVAALVATPSLWIFAARDRRLSTTRASPGQSAADAP